MRRLIFILLLFVASQLKGELTFYCPFESSIDTVVNPDLIKATCNDCSKFSSGKRGNSLILGNEHTKINYISEKPFFASDGMLEVWIKPVTWKGIDKKSTIQLELKVSEDLRFQIFKDRDSSNLIFQTKTKTSVRSWLAPIYYVVENKWVHIIATKKGDEIGFFCDGQKAISSNRIEYFNETEISPESYLLINCEESTAIDELRIYNQFFTDEEIRERYISSLLGEKSYVLPTIGIPYTKNPPVMEGAFDPNAWDNAAVLGNFIKLDDASMFGLQTWVYMMYDDNNIYFMYKSPVTSEGLTGGPRGRDELSGGDEIELYLMPKYTETFDFFQFIGNPWNSIYDGKGLNGRSWDGDWFYRTQLDPQWWFAEVWMKNCALMAVKKPSEGTEWKVNFCRNWRTGEGAWTQWSQTPGVYQNYQNFGKLIFGSKEPIYVRVRNLADMDKERKTISADFELVNDSLVDKCINIKYDFYLKGDYLPTNSIVKQITVGPKQRQHVFLSHQLQVVPYGTVEVTVEGMGKGEVYLQQMVKVDSLK